MNTLTVPRDIKKGEELVVISRTEYENFLRRPKVDTWRAMENEADGDIRYGRLSPAIRTEKQLKKALALLKK